MRKIARRVDAGWLREEDIAEFPSLDLDTIDNLWTKYSDEHFGFSVQSRIWEKVGENYAKFGDAAVRKTASGWEGSILSSTLQILFGITCNSWD
jgi:hypothetical protein